MLAGVYHRSEPDRCCICGPEASSMTREGCEGASMAKKKSGPRPAQAVPSFRSLPLKVAVIASRRPAGLDLASAINCGAFIFSAAIAGASRQSDRRANLHMEQILYRVKQTKVRVGPGSSLQMAARRGVLGCTPHEAFRRSVSCG